MLGHVLKELARFVFRFCIRILLVSHCDLNPLLFFFGKSWPVNIVGTRERAKSGKEQATRF